LGGELETSPTDSTPQSPEKGSAAETQLGAAIEAIDREDYTAAVSILNSAIIEADEAKLPECYALRGYALLKLRQHERAEADCTKALELGYADVETYAWRAAARGQMLNWRGAFEDLNAARKLADDPGSYEDMMGKYYEPAMAWFRQRIQLDAPTARMFDDRGWINFYLGHLPKAKRDFELALQQNPNYGPSMLGMAEAALGLGHPQQAIEFSEMAVGADKDIEGAALICCVRAAHADGKTHLAIDALQKLRQMAQRRLSLFKQCAQLRLQIGDYVGAIEDFTNLINIEPATTLWYKLRGDTYAAINNPAMAAADYSQFLRLDPQRAAAWIRRGEMNTQLQRYDKAIRDFDRASELGLLNKDLFLGRARVHEALRQYDEAIDQCKKAQRLVPDSAEVFALEGNIYARQKIFLKALDQLSRAIELASDARLKAECLYRRGVVFYEMEQFVRAVEDLQRSHELRPNHAGTLIWRAAASSRLEDWPVVMEALQSAIALRPAAAEQYKTLGAPVAGKAVEYLTEQIQLDERDPELYRNRGMAFQFLGSHTAAIDDFSKSLELEPDPATQIRRGQSLAAAGRSAEALADFTAACNPAVPPAHRHAALYWRARTAHAAGESSQALNDIRAAIELSPEQARYHALRGDLLRKLGTPAEAIEALTRSIALDYSDHAPFFLRGQLYLKQRMYLKAIIDFCQSLDLYPNQPQVIALRGEAYLKNGQPKAALDDFELALTHDPTLVKAYCGRAQVLAGKNQAEVAAIWLTKAIHRFRNPRSWSQLLLARGKIFYQMGRFLPAIADFTTILEMNKQEPAARNAARYARAVALVQQGQLVKAQEELDRLVKDSPSFPGAQLALAWLATGQGQRPESLFPPKSMTRPRRPPVVTPPISIQANEQWLKNPPHDLWVIRMRDEDRTEYGPVGKRLLDQWVTEGRIPADAKLLRADWERWKRANQIYPELSQPRGAVPSETPPAHDTPIITTT
jgi:tetratricopeptide (TPR) repeat protein